jgi:hypothetical protein
VIAISTRKNEIIAGIASSTNRPVRIFPFTGIHGIMKLNINRPPEIFPSVHDALHISQTRTMHHIKADTLNVGEENLDV